MRIPGRKIWRAFAELDRFSDEQCARFVRAANRGFWWWCLRILVWGSCGVTMLAVVVAGVGFLTGRWERWFDDDIVEFVGDLPPWLAAGLLLPLVLLVIRDWLLIRRVRSILSGRGRCGGCGYGLLGLPVDEKLIVICPECGANTKVDQSLGELTVDGKGNARFQPSVDSLVVKTFWTARRKKWAIRGGLAATLVFVVLPLGAIGVREIWMRIEAGEARGDRAKFREEWEALLESAQPTGSSATDPDAWTFFAKIVEKHDAAFAALRQKDPERNPTGAVPMADLVYNPTKAPVDTGDAVMLQTQEERYREDMKSRELGLELVERLRKEGAFEQMAEMAATARSVPPFEIDWSRPLNEVFGPMLGKCRALLRVNAARMHLAREARDLDEFVRAAEANMALVRMARCGPNLIWQLVATAIQEANFQQCREYIAAGGPPELAGRLLEALKRQGVGTRYAAAVDGDRLVADDTIAWLFSEPSRVRYGMRSDAVKAIVGNGPANAPISQFRIGSYRDNRDKADACYNEAKARMGLESWERSASTADAREFPLVEAFLFAFDSVMKARDHGLVSERAFELSLRIEDFRVEHWSAPETLEALPGVNDKAIFRDPLTGGTFGYSREMKFDWTQFPEPEFDEAAKKALMRQSYLLYSAGHDGVIDFKGDGKVFAPLHEVAWNSIPRGADVLLTPMPKRQK